MEPALMPAFLTVDIGRKIRIFPLMTTCLRRLLLTALLAAFGSCQYFDTEKIQSETIYQREYQTIDWDSVDRYPRFANCEELEDKPVQQACFQSTLLQHLYNDLSTRTMELIEAGRDTVWIDFSVSVQGNIENTNIQMDSLLQLQLPEFRQWIMESLQTLPQPEPAYKRSIPVETRFTLPIVVYSGD